MSLADVLPPDLDHYISERIGEQTYVPTTVDRKLGLISQIINRARKTLRIHLHEAPTYGVRCIRAYTLDAGRGRKSFGTRLLPFNILIKIHCTLTACVGCPALRPRAAT